ncbi:MAG: GNAT family protein [Pseudomonadota bacterium]
MPDLNVTLRIPQPSDAVAPANVPPSAEIVRMYGGDVRALPEPSLTRSVGWLTWLRDHPFARMIDLDNVPVGHVRLHALVDADRRARLAIGLFRETHLNRGIGRRAIALTLDHAFGEMALHRLDLRVLAYNTRAIRCYLACGFRHEGTEREAAKVGDAWHDEWVMGILASDDRR